MVAEIADMNPDELRYQREWYAVDTMYKKILKLAVSADFGEEYDLGDGVSVSFKTPTDINTSDNNEV